MRSRMTLPSHHRQFINKLLQYTTEKNLKNGKKLHAQIIKTTQSSSSNTYLSNTLINLYGKCNLIFEATLVFERIPEKDVVSYNCLINLHSRLASHTSHAIASSLFRRMISENTLPNPHTFAGVFASNSISGNIQMGLQAHSVAVKLSCVDDVFVGSALVNMYCKMGFVFGGRKVFDEMPERNSITWATLVSGYASLRLAKEAMEVFELMRMEMEVVNEFVVTSVLSGFTGTKVVDSGRQIHGLVVKDGLLSFVWVGNALVTMYSKCGVLDDAFQTFKMLGDKNSITWSAMVTGYAQCGDSKKALELFSDMHFSGVGPSEFTLVGVINACSDIGAIEEGKQGHGYSLKLGFESQMFIMTALVDMYAKCGCVADARKGFDYLKEPDIVLWTSMISGYVQNGDNENAMLLYGKMEKEGIMPNELTMASVLKACSTLAALEKGKQVHARAIKYGFSLEIPIGSALSTMYAKCGSLEDGNIVFRRMPGRDVVSWNAMISGLSQNGHGSEALELFEEMRMEGTKPDYVTFVNILSACSHIGLVDKGWVYFNMMFDEFGIDPRVEHCACMVDILSRAGKLNEARNFIETAKIDHGMCLWRILLSACRNYRNYELGAYAGEKLMELGSQESSAYVLLSSIYTALGRPRDVERVRRMMKVRGVTKEPGCSWIELKSWIHAFFVGDQMHPQIRDIRNEIKRLSNLMMDQGYKPDSSLVTFLTEDN